MKTTIPALATAAIGLSFLTGCVSSSISDSGYYHSSYYRGELSEFSVVGITSGTNITDAVISTALTDSHQVVLHKRQPVMVIQSGAATPDEPLLEELQKHFSVVPFSGVPVKETPLHAESLRLTAANGGCAAVICYWGVLERARANEATKGVSWVPVVGHFIPDERQRMRIRLRATLMDVASGHWVMLNPPPFGSDRLSAGLIRESSDQYQVDTLKSSAYKSLVQQILNYSS
jgi:hypothetical protein